MAHKLAASIPLTGYADGGPRQLAQTIAPDDPLLARQWALGPAGANVFPLALPDDAARTPVLVAVIDGGIDASVPELAGAVVEQRSFVPDGALRSSLHGTLVAGIVAAATGNGAGIAAPSLGAQLLDLQVVRPDSTIEPADEARAIRYAVDRGARVINLSFGALRNPGVGPPDEFSRVEAAAIRYAVAHDVVVVAAGGNRGWRFVDWPAALPHVLGVGATNASGAVASFSNTDPERLDLAAPGVSVISTVPIAVTPSGLSVDAPGVSGLVDVDGGVSGTSFAAPHVAAAAALVRSVRPELTADQVTTLLAGSARDADRSGHDRTTGFGHLDVQALVARALTRTPAVDVREPNDDGGRQASRVRFRRFTTVRATVSRFEDPLDVYCVALDPATRLELWLAGPERSDLDVFVLPPWITEIASLRRSLAAETLAASVGPGSRAHLRVRGAAAGCHPVVVHAHRGGGRYTLSLRRTAAAP